MGKNTLINSIEEILIFDSIKTSIMVFKNLDKLRIKGKLFRTGRIFKNL